MGRRCALEAASKFNPKLKYSHEKYTHDAKKILRYNLEFCLNRCGGRRRIFPRVLPGFYAGAQGCPVPGFIPAPRKEVIDCAYRLCTAEIGVCDRLPPVPVW